MTTEHKAAPNPWRPKLQEGACSYRMPWIIARNGPYGDCAKLTAQHRPLRFATREAAQAAADALNQEPAP